MGTCGAISGAVFYQGVGVARNIPQNSLDDFDIRLYCLSADEIEVDINDPSREPDAILTGNFASLQDGILRRTGPGFNYYKISKPASPTDDFSQKLYGPDTEDGSKQGLTITCAGGLCDIILADASFSTCINNIPGDIFLGGVALAKNVPQDNLDSFSLDLYCIEDINQLVAGIDYDSNPATTLDGSLLFLENGVVRRTGPNFTYFNRFKSKSFDKLSKATAITNGKYSGSRFSEGGEDSVFPTCTGGICQVTLHNFIFPECIIPATSFNPYFNGFGIARNITKDSLDKFDIDIYCKKLGQEVDFDVDEPTYTREFGLVPIYPRGAILRPDTDPNIVYFKLSTGFP